MLTEAGVENHPIPELVAEGETEGHPRRCRSLPSLRFVCEPARRHAQAQSRIEGEMGVLGNHGSGIPEEEACESENLDDSLE